MILSMRGISRDMNRNDVGQAVGQDVRTRVLEAAFELLSETGTLKMRDLAERAEVAHVTPYNVFGSKRELLAEISRSLIAESRDKLELHTYRNGLEYLFAALDRTSSTLTDDPSFYRALYREAYGGRDFALLETVQRPRLDFWNEVLLRCREEGIFKASMKTESVTQSLVYLFAGSVSRWINESIDTTEMLAELNVPFLKLLEWEAFPKWRPFIEDRIRYWSNLLPAEPSPEVVE
ncbi:TetR/AcrR family transcriptional regulator [Novosphingobium pentaromativorans]|uniref:TetR/AcrR family transcriptional regulator n=1 Tax=Novosphingobium pentaromativorans TaxID=205844 RepID=UPI000AA35021|nr:TetR/AcrR family transcriptional regulator [Novosphingobium pentaromativorans]